MVSVLQRTSSLVLLVLALEAFAAPPRGGSAPPVRTPEIEQAEELISAGEFEEAVRALQQALRRPQLSDATLAEIYGLMGLAALYLGNEERARQAYERLLTADPNYELPRNAPPKIQALFLKIKDDLRTRRLRPVSLQLLPLGTPEPGVPFEVKARIQELPEDARARLYYRRSGTEVYGSTGFAPAPDDQDVYRAVVPGVELPRERFTYDVELYAEVADGAQRRLAGEGDAFNPLRLPVAGIEPGGAAAPREAEKRWYQKPWVWGLGAAAVAGAGVTAFLLTRPEDRGTLPLTIRVQP